MLKMFLHWSYVSKWCRTIKVHDVLVCFIALQNHCVMFPHSSIFGFVNCYFLPVLCRTSIQKWKKNWFHYVHIARKGVLPSPLFYGTLPLTQLAPPSFFKFCVPSPLFCFTPFKGILDSFPHPHTTPSCPNLTNQPFLF